ncbi:DUF1648 domain-containing protein [Streptomyces sp. LX-29]|uniref:DUF1648 domain-containing protein n=1 Tax=Streptomyces sp. LX-29 TaxID=2900152 RepID=UPI00240E7772|nr:DUF1648 domain-containing protein [Streptomyces sp. LX-29]WFB10684.1 DUF1648 domain-containing protein [Streptomyces sp. LX-29]
MFRRHEGPSGHRRTAVVTLAFGLAAAAVSLGCAGLWDRLPDRLATHFGAGGAADGFTARGDFLGVALGVLLGLGALFGTLTHLGREAPGAQRALTAAGCAVAALLGAAFGVTLWANAGADEAGAVTLAGGQLALVCAATAALGGLGWLLAGPGAPPPVTRRTPVPTAPRLELADGERASWTHTAGSRPIAYVGLALAVAGVVAGVTVGWGSGIGLLAGGVPLALLTGARVTVDRRGLTVAPLLLPRPRLIVPLDRIEEATEREVNALRDFAGWGYRAHSGASGVILRSGGALSARLSHGSEFVVTVDDARTAAALLNALVVRERTAPGA